MNDPLTQVEARLAGLKLRPLSSTVRDRIGESLNRPSGSERRELPLWGAIVSGAIAACITVTMLLMGPSTPEPGRSSVVHVLQSRHTTGEQALASASARWGDELTQIENRRFP